MIIFEVKFKKTFVEAFQQIEEKECVKHRKEYVKIQIGEFDDVGCHVHVDTI